MDAPWEIFYADSLCQCVIGFVETCNVDGLNLSFTKSINIIADSYKQTQSVGDEDVQFAFKLNAECWMLNAEEVLRTNTRGGANGMVEHKKLKFN